LPARFAARCHVDGSTAGRLAGADETVRERSRVTLPGTPKGQPPRNLSGIRDRTGQAALESRLTTAGVTTEGETAPDGPLWRLP